MNSVMSFNASSKAFRPSESKRTNDIHHSIEKGRYKAGRYKIKGNKDGSLRQIRENVIQFKITFRR